MPQRRQVVYGHLSENVNEGGNLDATEGGDGALLETFAHLGMIGADARFIACLHLVRKFARCAAPVLIRGETGTGKELAARALHYMGARRGKPFIPVNCGALPETLLESELFGYEKGAFTDARQAHKGLVAHAEGGTLFLDEVDSLSARAQVVLLRFLQDKVYRPLGGASLQTANISVIAASNADLGQLVTERRFRDDLLYRLNVAEIRLPSLRERRGDIALLAAHFVRVFSEYYEVEEKRIHPDSLAWLARQPWPGNVRELENAIHRAWLMSDGPVLEIGPVIGERARELAEPDAIDSSFNTARAAVLHDFERRYLHRLMAAAEGNVSRAARLAQKERRTIGRLLKKHNIDRRQYCPEDECESG